MGAGPYRDGHEYLPTAYRRWIALSMRRLGMSHIRAIMPHARSMMGCRFAILATGLRRPRRCEPTLRGSFDLGSAYGGMPIDLGWPLRRVRRIVVGKVLADANGQALGKSSSFAVSMELSSGGGEARSC